MYVISKHSKIYHNNVCFYAKKINSENAKYAYKSDEFKGDGYMLCRCCSKLASQYRTEKSKISSYAVKNHIKVWLENNELFIETSVASWKLTDADNKGKFVLLHSNTESYSRLKKNNGRYIHNYHIQKKVRSNTILGYIKYIYHHDVWRDEKLDEYKTLPKGTNKQKHKYNRERQKSEKAKLRNVLNMIDMIRAEREYKEQCL